MNRVFVLEQDGQAALAFFCGHDGSRGPMGLLDAIFFDGGTNGAHEVKDTLRDRVLLKIAILIDIATCD